MKLNRIAVIGAIALSLAAAPAARAQYTANFQTNRQLSNQHHQRCDQ